MRFGNAKSVIARWVSGPIQIMPKRHTVGAPVTCVRPPRQRLAGIPLPLPKMQESARREFLSQTTNKRRGQTLLGWAKCGGIPFLTIEVIDRDECRFTAHGQPDIGSLEFLIDSIAKAVDIAPL